MCVYLFIFGISLLCISYVKKKNKKKNRQWSNVSVKHLKQLI